MAKNVTVTTGADANADAVLALSSTPNNVILAVSWNRKIIAQVEKSNQDPNKKQQWTTEAQSHAKQALEIDENSAYAHIYYAISTGILCCVVIVVIFVLVVTAIVDFLSSIRYFCQHIVTIVFSAPSFIWGSISKCFFIAEFDIWS